jgi:hypothetical protein
LANADTLSKMSFRRGKERYKVCTAGALVVNWKSFRAGRAADIDNLAGFSFKAYKVSIPITKDRTDDEQTFTRFTLKHE